MGKVTLIYTLPPVHELNMARTLAKIAIDAVLNCFIFVCVDCYLFLELISCFHLKILVDYVHREIFRFCEQRVNAVLL